MVDKHYAYQTLAEILDHSYCHVDDRRRSVENMRWDGRECVNTSPSRVQGYLEDATRGDIGAAADTDWGAAAEADWGNGNQGGTEQC